MLVQLDAAILDHFQKILETVNPAYDADHVRLVLVDDVRSHFKLLERWNQDTSIPFAVLERAEIRHADSTNHGSSRFTEDDIIISKDTSVGLARTIKAARVEIQYRLHIYQDDFAELSNLTEYWFLNAGGLFTKFSFTLTELDNQTMEASVTLEEPEAINPTMDEVRQDGLIFEQTFPILLRTVLVSQAVNRKIIVTNVLNFHIQDNF